MDHLLAEVRNDLKEVKSLVIDLTRQSAIHNEILKEHEKRSTQLEERFKPVEDTWVFVSKLFAVILTFGSVAAALLAIVKVVELFH